MAVCLRSSLLRRDGFQQLLGNVKEKQIMSFSEKPKNYSEKTKFTVLANPV